MASSSLVLTDEDELAIEAMLTQSMPLAASPDIGRARRIEDARGRYIHAVKGSLPDNVRLDGLKIAVDCANGAAYQVAPSAIWELGAEVITIGVSPNGKNINDKCGSTHLDLLKETVVGAGADIGIALDGDADRLQLVDSQGRLFNGDELLYLMADERLRRGEAVPGVVGTLMTNMAVELALQARGVELVRAKVGDRYVLEVLEQRQWLLGGEGSGHLLALDKHTTGDGLVSALQVLQAIVRSGQSLAELLQAVTLFPQTLINVRLQPGQDWQSNAAMAQATRAVETELGQSGRVLIRASGTEPLVRVMVEARDPAQARSCAERIAATLAG